MPTPDPSVLPLAVTTVTTLFTSNWQTFVTAAIAVIGIIVLPALLIRAGLGKAVRALRGVFKGA